MTTEDLNRRIDIIAHSNKNNGKIKVLIEFVEGKIMDIKNFDLRDSLMEKLTRACCN